MKKRLALLGAFALSVPFLFACAPIAPASQDHAAIDERVLLDARLQYRDASLVVSASCIGSHLDSNGETRIDMRIDEVFAGDAAEGDHFHFTDENVTVGNSYLLYLTQDETPVHYSEDTAGYDLVSDEPHTIVDGEVLFGDVHVPFSMIEEDMDVMASEIDVPAPVYYYDGIVALAHAAQEIVIGRVLEVPEPEEMLFVSRDGGSSKREQSVASIVSIETYGSVKGAIGYGEQISLVHSPSRVHSVIDEATLRSMSFDAASVPALTEGGLYLFFLMESPGGKQDYYFLMNPVQGFVGVEDEQIFVAPDNLSLIGYRSFTQLVEALQHAMTQTPPSTVGSLEVTQ